MRYWKVFTDANSENKAEKVSKKFIAKLGVECALDKIEPYATGFVCTFSSVMNTSNWSECVLDSLTLAQKVGRAWVLSGAIEDELDIWSNAPSVMGVNNIQLLVTRNTQYTEA